METSTTPYVSEAPHSIIRPLSTATHVQLPKTVLKVNNFKVSQVGINLNPRDQAHQKVVTKQSVSSVAVTSSLVEDDPILKNLMPSQKVAYLRHLESVKREEEEK
jgi:hypothetical protein